MPSAVPFRGILTGFLASAKRFPSRPALVVHGKDYSYLGLQRASASIAATILGNELISWPLAALLASRSKTAYTGILGILGAGKGYVPLNPKFPIARTLRMLLLSGCSTIVVGGESTALLPDLLG